MKFLTALLVVVAMFSTLIVARDFGGSCRSTDVIGSVLWGYCTKEDGHETWGSVDLNDCLLNDDGFLKWAAGGHYYNTCKYWGCDYSEHQQNHDYTYIYSCWCQKNDKKYRQSSVFLNTRITNRNGQLSCDL